MFIALIVLILICAVLMALVILLQNGKGGGLAGIASGGQTTQILGARQAPDFLEKATWTLGGAFLILCLLTTFFVPGGGTSGRSILQERADEVPAGAPATLPGTAAPGTAAPGAPNTSTPGATTAPGSNVTPDGAPASEAAPQATPVSPAPPAPAEAPAQ